MKSKVRRISKKSLAMLLSMVILFSSIFIGSIFTAYAGDNHQAFAVYFAMPNTWTPGSYVYMCARQNGYYTILAKMSNVTDNLYRCTNVSLNHSSWNDESILFSTGNTPYNAGYEGANSSTFTHKTEALNEALNNSAKTWYFYCTDNNTTNSIASVNTSAWHMQDLNNNSDWTASSQEAKAYTDGSESTTGGTVTVTTYGFSSETGSGVSNRENATLVEMSDGTGLRGTNVVVTATSKTNYRFEGFYSDAALTSALTSEKSTDTTTTSGGTYTYYINSGDTKTVYAKFVTDTVALTPDPTISFNNSATADKTVTASSTTSSTLTVTNHSSIHTNDSGVTYKLYKGGSELSDAQKTSMGITYSNGAFTIPNKYSNAGTYKVVAVPTSGSTTYHNSADSNNAVLTVNRTNLDAPEIEFIDGTTSASANYIGSSLDPVAISITNYANLKDYCSFAVNGATRGDIDEDGRFTLTGGTTAAYDGHDNTINVTATLTASSEYYTINNSETSATSGNVTLTVYKPIYALSGNVARDYLEGSTLEPQGGSVTDENWWKTYHPEMAVSTPTEKPGKYSVTFRTLSKSELDDNNHQTINVGLVMGPADANGYGTQYGFRMPKSGTTANSQTASDYNFYNWLDSTNKSTDYDVTANITDAMRCQVQTMDDGEDQDPGGSFILHPNTVYTITIDQTVASEYDSANNPNGQINIIRNTYWVNTKTMVQTLDPNTGTYNSISAAPSYVGSATASPTSGSATATFNSTLTATTDTSLYDFEGWFNEKTCETSERVSTNNPYTASITKGETFYALFKEKAITYTLSATAENPENYNGTVAIGTHHPGTVEGVEKVYKGATVTFTASPAAGTKVEGWYVNGKLQDGALGNTFTINGISEDTVVTAKFKVKTNEAITVRVNDSDLGSAAVTQVAGAAPASPAVAAEGETVQVTLTAKNEGDPSGITVIDDVTGATVTPTQVSKDSNTGVGVYSFTMPENPVTVTANFGVYSGTSSYYFDGRKSDKTAKSSYKNIQMSEAKYNGQKYAYYRVNYDSESSSKYYFTVKTNTTADLGADGYIYVEGWNDFNAPNMWIQYYSSNAWSGWKSMQHVTDINTTGKIFRSKETPPSGTTKIQIYNGGKNGANTYSKQRDVSNDTYGMYKVYGDSNGSGGSDFAIDQSPANFNSSTYSDMYRWGGSSTNTTGMYLMTDSPATYYGTSDTALAVKDITATSTVLPTVSSTNLSKPFYVLVFYPNTNYGSLVEGEAAFNNTNSTPKIIVSKVLPGGTPPVTPIDVYAKDGTLRADYHVQAEAATTTITKVVAPDGTTIFQNTSADSTTGSTAHGGVANGTTISASSGTITIGSESGVSYTPIMEGSGDAWYEKLTKIPKGSTVTVRTVLSNTKNMFNEAKGDGKSFRETHYVRGYSCNGVTYALHDYDSSGVYTEDIKIPMSVSIDNFEITPVFYMKDTSNCKTFIITGFDKKVQSTGWGNTLAVYPYYYNTGRSKAAFGGYPGSPLLFYGGTYMIQIPVTNDGTSTGKEIRGMTLSNYYWDTVHRIVDSEELKDHRQTYDYDDFVKIYKEKNPDNIYMSYKYRTKKDNSGSGYHYSQNTSGNSATYNDYAGSNGNGVEDFVDALGRRIDIFGNVLTSRDISNAGNSKVLIVSDGYCDTYVGDYATEWTIYKTTDGGSTYTKVSKSISPSALIMNDEDSWNKKYTGFDDNKAGKLGYYKGIYTALKESVKGLPAEISYEKEIRNYSKDQANRLDARWLYSFDSDKISANIKIEYLPLNATKYVEDTFTNTNQGTVTGTKAYFTNYTPKDVYEQVEAKDFVVDPDSNFTMMAEEASGYEFVGWYVQYEGHDGETPVSKEGELSGESPIVANATYVARFKAVQSGSVNVSHVVEKTDTYKGTGTPYMYYVIKDGSGTVIETNGGFKNSSTTTFKNSSYIKSKYSDYTIDVYLAVVPDSGCTFGEFYDDGVPTNFKLNKNNTTLPTGITAPEGAYSKYAKASFTVAQVLADTTNNGSYKYVSHINLTETYTYKYDITYTFRSRSWGDQQYNVNGTFTQGQLKNYTTGTTTSSRLTTEFIKMHRPYESNFLEKIDWNYSDVTQSCSDIGSGTDHIYNIVANVSSTQDEDLVVHGEFMLPYYSTNGVANENSNGKTLYTNDGDPLTIDTEFLGLFRQSGDYYRFDDTGTSFKYGDDYLTKNENGKTYAEYSLDIYNSLKDTNPDLAAKYNPATNTEWLTQFWTYQIAPKLDLLNAPEKLYRLNAATDRFEQTYNYEPTLESYDAAIDTALSEITKDDATPITSINDIDEQSKLGLEQTFMSHDKNNHYYEAFENFYKDYYDITVTKYDRTYTVTINGKNYSYEREFIDSVKVTGIKDTADLSKFDELKFYRWKVQSTSKSTSAAKSLTYCYDKEFNLAGFENYVITPEYYTDSELAELKSVEPDAKATIVFLENSRNQWNVDNGAKFSETDTKTMVKADKLFADFNLAFNYNGTVINQSTENIKVGVLIQQVELLDELSTGKPVTDPRYYTAKTTVSDSEKTALENLAKTTTKTSTAPGHITINSRVDGSMLSSKNRIEYYFTFNNKNVVYSNNIREFSDTTDRNYVYRAFSYIYDKSKGDGGTVYLSDEPAYFTLYDVATM